MDSFFVVFSLMKRGNGKSMINRRRVIKGPFLRHGIKGIGP